MGRENATGKQGLHQQDGMGAGVRAWGGGRRGGWALSKGGGEPERNRSKVPPR